MRRRRSSRVSSGTSNWKGRIAPACADCSVMTDMSAPYSLDDRDERFAFFDDVGGELRRVAAAHVRHGVDRSRRNGQRAACGDGDGLLPLDLVLELAFEDVDDLL